MRSELNEPLRSSKKNVSTLDEGLKRPVSHAPVQHPQPAVGMNISESALAHNLDNPLDALRDKVRLLDFIVLHVHDSNS